MQFLITRKTFCAGFVPFVSFVVYIVANRFDRITDYGFNHKAHKDHRGLAKVLVLCISRLCGEISKKYYAMQQLPP